MRGLISEGERPTREGGMADTIFILLSIGLFYLAIRYVKWADKV